MVKLNATILLLSFFLLLLKPSQSIRVNGFEDSFNLINEIEYLVADFSYDLELDYHTENYGGAYSGPDAPSHGYNYELY